MPKWEKMTVGDLCDTISDTYRGDDKDVVLINTSDVLEGKVLNHQVVENKNLNEDSCQNCTTVPVNGYRNS